MGRYGIVLVHRQNTMANKEEARNELPRDQKEAILRQKEWKNVTRRAKTKRAPDGWSGTQSDGQALTAYEQHAKKVLLACDNDAAPASSH